MLFRLDPEAPETPEALESLAASDPSLALGLLQRVAARAPQSSLMSISEALARLGSRTIQESLTRAPVTAVFLPPPAVARRLWLHSVQVGHWAAAIAWQAQLSVRPARAYVAGLLHDIGRFIELRLHPEARVSLERDWEVVEDLMRREREQLGVDHARLGALACERWGLPEPLRFAIAHHHEPPGRWPRAPEETLALARAVRVADSLSLLMQERPDLADASAAARSAALRGALRGEAELDPKALATQWKEIATRSDRACRRAGLHF